MLRFLYILTCVHGDLRPWSDDKHMMCQWKKSWKLSNQITKYHLTLCKQFPWNDQIIVFTLRAGIPFRLTMYLNTPRRRGIFQQQKNFDNNISVLQRKPFSTRREPPRRREGKYHGTVCPRSREPFYIVSYYIKWVTTSCTYSRYHGKL